MITIARPASNAGPTSTVWSARMMFLPSPGASMRTVITTIDEGHHHRLVDAQDDRPAGHRQLDLARASGSRVEPSASAASTVVGETPRMPRAVIRIAGGIA